MLNTWENMDKDNKRRLERKHHTSMIESASMMDLQNTAFFNQHFDFNEPLENINLANLDLHNVAFIEDMISETRTHRNGRPFRFCYDYINCYESRWKIAKIMTKHVALCLGIFLFIFFGVVGRTNQNGVVGKLAWNGKQKLIGEWIAENGISSRADLINQDSPQNKALNWMITKDEITQKQMVSIERYILATFYFSTSDWKVKDYWLSNKTVCEWWGVQCSKDADVVIGLTMKNNSIKGSLPSEIMSLGALKTLDLECNNINGTITETLGRLINLSKC